MSKLILSESRYDFKYKSIFKRISDIQVKEGKYLELLKVLIKNKSYYHIRYIKYRGAFLSTLRILLVYVLSKISGSKIIWTCHNIYEHNIPNKKLNDFLRYLLCSVSYKIIVFHKDLKKYLPQLSQKKVLVATFGEFKSFIESKSKENAEFWNLYQSWLKSRQIKNPDIVSISAAKRNNLEELIKKINNTEYNVLIIAPNQNIKSELQIDSNICIYNSNFVEKEINFILNKSDKMIGFIGHENISVPTSIYMYASFGIPIIGLDIEPVSTIIRDYDIGEILTNTIPLENTILKIKNNYKYYQNNCISFLKDNSWEKSAEIHKMIFQ